MKKLFIITSIFIFQFILMAGVNKAEFIKKFSEAQKIQRTNLSGYMEIEMYMMGLPVKMWGNFWMKGHLYKVDMLTKLPNNTTPVNSVIIFDGKNIWRIGKLMIIKIDVNKLPKQIRQEQIQNSAYFDINEFSKSIEKYYKQANITEKTMNNEKYYVITIEGQIIKQNIPSNINGLKKIILWINEKDMLIRKIELYGKGKTPGVSIILKNLSTKPIPNSMFVYNPSKNAKIFDMTNLIGTEYKTMNNNQP